MYAVCLTPLSPAPVQDMMDRALSAPRDEKKRRGGARDRDRDRDRDRRQKETSTPADEGAGPPAVTPVAPASSASAPSQLNDIDTPQK